MDKLFLPMWNGKLNAPSYLFEIEKVTQNIKFKKDGKLDKGIKRADSIDILTCCSQR